jgi:hypothetical protein
MRLLIVLLVLLGTVESIYAAGKQVADFKSRSGERVSVIQETKKYGLDLIITKFGIEPGTKKETRRVRNAFGVVLDKPSAIFLCWIANGHFFRESFQILEIDTLKAKTLKVEPEPTSDDPQCLIEENEKYFLIFDDFPDRQTTYVFNREGEAVRTDKGDLRTDIEIDGKVYRFVKGRTFGGFR